MPASILSKGWKPGFNTLSVHLANSQSIVLCLDRDFASTAARRKVEKVVVLQGQSSGTFRKASSPGVHLLSCAAPQELVWPVDRRCRKGDQALVVIPAARMGNGRSSYPHWLAQSLSTLRAKGTHSLLGCVHSVTSEPAAQFLGM